MSENETEDKDVAEFVAVTPRASRDETPSEPVAPELVAGSDSATEAEQVDDAAAEDVAPVAEVAEAADAGAEESEAEPAEAGATEAGATEAGATDPDEARSEPEAAQAPVAANEDLEHPSADKTRGEADAAPEAATEPEEPAEVTPVATLKWTPPSLERPAAPGASEPGSAEPAATEPDTTVDGPVEVSVRVAAEGMAAALAGDPATLIDGRENRERSVGPLAIVTAVCVVLAIAAGVVLALAAHSNSRHRATAAARVAALEAAKKETALALTYDYRTLDADFQRAEAGMSRKFRASYAETAATSVTPLAQKTHAISTGTVAAGGVVMATPERARVLVFANQVIQNQQLNATSRLDRSVIDVSMVKEDGHWVIDDLNPF
ncbi:MAG TPA: hypothetical protein VHE57_03475 [Mycobacteriales bacterium]|nr:hypothetical protein [Mycobacteriales bacterium]